MKPLQFAVFGHPVGHSLSPRIQQAFARQFGLDIDYRAIDAAPVDFEAAVQAFFAGGGHGANVTLPHKAAAFALATQYSQAALRAGTANVLTRQADGSLAAHNTDGTGLLRDLLQRRAAILRGRSAILLGAGGAARGVAWNLLDAGLHHLTIVNRSPAPAQALAAAIDLPERASARRWGELPALGGFDLVIHATSAGVLGIALDLPTSLAAEGAMCCDLSYGPAAASFLAWAEAAGASQACDGLGMLVETAADSFELWHGRRPATEPVYRSLRQRAP